jgi:hypothetical protein
MFFVLHQHQEYGRTFENNIRMGGYKHQASAFDACKKAAPAIVRNEHREVVAQSVSPFAPNYLR